MESGVIRVGVLREGSRRMGERVGDGGEAGRVLGAVMGQDESLKPSLFLPGDSSFLAGLPASLVLTCVHFPLSSQRERS